MPLLSDILQGDHVLFFPYFTRYLSCFAARFCFPELPRPIRLIAGSSPVGSSLNNLSKPLRTMDAFDTPFFFASNSRRLSCSGSRYIRIGLFLSDFIQPIYVNYRDVSIIQGISLYITFVFSTS